MCSQPILPFSGYWFNDSLLSLPVFGPKARKMFSQRTRTKPWSPWSDQDHLFPSEKTLAFLSQSWSGEVSHLLFWFGSKRKVRKSRPNGIGVKEPFNAYNSTQIECQIWFEKALIMETTFCFSSPLIFPCFCNPFTKLPHLWVHMCASSACLYVWDRHSNLYYVFYTPLHSVLFGLCLCIAVGFPTEVWCLVSLSLLLHWEAFSCKPWSTRG